MTAGLASILRYLVALDLEIGCDNSERVRVPSTLDWCGCWAITRVATTCGIDRGDDRDLMSDGVERRFGQVNRLPRRSDGRRTTARPTLLAKPER
jgi:hypothetical protein